MYTSPKVRVSKNYPSPSLCHWPKILPPPLPIQRMLSSDCEIAFNTSLWIDRRLRVVVFFSNLCDKFTSLDRRMIVKAVIHF